LSLLRGAYHSAPPFSATRYCEHDDDDAIVVEWKSSYSIASGKPFESDITAVGPSRSGDRRAAAPPPARIGSATRRQGCGAGRRHLPPCHLSFAAAFVCHPAARGRVRHSDDSGPARASGRENDDDLHARVEPGRAGRAESARSIRAGSENAVTLLCFPFRVDALLLSSSAYHACRAARPKWQVGLLVMLPRLESTTSSRYAAGFV
jgi:hypothetical protein